jgi:hypothetical protein
MGGWGERLGSVATAPRLKGETWGTLRGFLKEFLLVGIEGEGTVVSHISRKTSEMWGTPQVPPLRSHGTPGQAG